MEPKKVITLCPACGGCPAIELFDEVVKIGEAGNQVQLKREEWNDLVDKITRGEVGKI